MDLVYPADLLNLANWKINLPVAGPDGSSQEILQPDLATFADPRYFYLNAAKDGVVFRCPTMGATTPNTRFPRTELRETNGGERAAWSSRVGTHTMLVTAAIVPDGAPVVCAQIHGENDVLMIRQRGPKITLLWGGRQYGDLTPSYAGEKFTIRLVAAGGKVFVKYNAQEEITLPWVSGDLYFKAGAYVQQHGGVGQAEVVLYDLTVKHE